MYAGRGCKTAQDCQCHAIVPFIISLRPEAVVKHDLITTVGRRINLCSAAADSLPDRHADPWNLRRQIPSVGRPRGAGGICTG